VRVGVSALAVNPVDVYIRSGAYPLKLPNPFVVGRDMVGVVAEVGEGVTGFEVGDRVWCNNQGYAGRQGTFAQQVVVDQALLYPLPAGVEPQQAVLTLHSALTAVTGMERCGLKAGDTLFVSGGSGNVGLAVLQIARALGVRVAVTAGSAEKIELCAANGADRVIDYKRENVAEAVREFAPHGLDVYWETTRNFDAAGAVELLAHRGRIVLMAGLERRCEFPVGPFYTKNISLHGFTITDSTVEELAGRAKQINGWLARGVLKTRLHAVFPLSQTAAAHRMMESGDLPGKLLVVPD
jgi:NADPH2:quinone reductase